MSDNTLDMLQLLSEREMTKVLGIKYSMIRKMRIEDGLPFVSLGKKIMYRPRTVQKWLEEREAESSNKRCLNKVRRIY
ncbi:helix-turn-helix domain-containing protein [Pectinatus frisingensis]|uniref:helix-turn-helix domain-containing protein n=1 Tax=Pectinatus frisingensis TaxID=865 RepID=UPI0018C59F34|nr:helix-turn-helix domain-containing protein [Pectinatus frisingensis]